MASDLNSLSKWLEKLSKRVYEGAENLDKETALAVINRLAEATPVDTGQARSNWQLGLGAMPSGTRKPFSPIPSRWKPPYPTGGNRGERRNLLGVSSAAQGVLRGYKYGQAIYIANNLPYIERLDGGYSPQSSAGWIRAGFRAGVALGLRNARFKL